jgi:hypothetical protein
VGWRGTLALLAVVAGAALYLYQDVNAGRRERSWGAIFEEPRETPPGEQITHLLSFAAADVTAITVRRGTAQWRAERTAAGWSGTTSPSWPRSCRSRSAPTPSASMASSRRRGRSS